MPNLQQNCLENSQFPRPHLYALLQTSTFLKACLNSNDVYGLGSLISEQLNFFEI